MFIKLLTLSVLIASVLCLSIGAVSEHNVTKRENAAGDLFPDWVPFKNKHGEELGEFIQVKKKSKVKKRLALPINFLMRAVAEPEGDDYYDKAAGESDSEDYFEKKDWSDLHRPAATVDKSAVKLKHSDISDIDGVVDIITKRPLYNLAGAVNIPILKLKQKPKIEEIIDTKNYELELEDEDTSAQLNDKPKKRVEPLMKDDEKKVSFLSKQKPTTYSNNESDSNEDYGDTSKAPKKSSNIAIENNEDYSDTSKTSNKIKNYESENNEDYSDSSKTPKKISNNESESNEDYSDSSKIPKKISNNENENNEDYSDSSKTPKKFSNNESENNDHYGDGTSEKPKNSTSQEDKATEERKAKILSSVDELKERHATEQRQLSERLRADELYRHENENNKETFKQYENEFGAKKQIRKFPIRFYDESSEITKKPRSRKLTTKPDYEEYDELTNTNGDKYKINAFKPTETTISEENYATTESQKTLSSTERVRKGKRIETGKLSVFKNPRLYMLYDDSDEVPTATPLTNNTGPLKFSSRYSTDTIDKEGRISLVPVDAKEGEPTLFFPKLRKNRRRKIITTTVATDSSVAETATDNYKQTTAIDVIDQDTTASDTTADDSSSGESVATSNSVAKTAVDDTTGTDTVSINIEAVTDAIPASSDHKKEHGGDYESKKGGGREHHSEHSSEHEEHGKKAYKGHHEEKKASEGHHDKENHLGKYDDHGGVDKHHSEESGHYGDHHHEEHGKKHAEYEESGKHSKGHSTKGSHDIHKKEEYEKNVEFFEEDGDSADDEKHGGYHHEKGHAEGGNFKKGNLHAEHKEHKKGDSEHFTKGVHHYGDKGHKEAGGHDSHGKRGGRHFQKVGKDSGKKWVFHHGYPAKTANLVVIDRRGDQYYHGPHYYG